MPEPQTVGGDTTTHRVQQILEARGINPTTHTHDDTPTPDEPGHPEYHRRQRIHVATTRWTAATPPRYQTATATHPAVLDWATTVTTRPKTAPSLLITGPTGTGKTHQAYGAFRAIADAGPHDFRMLAVTSADMYGSLRPTGNAGAAEHELGRLCDIPLLLLDDLGSAKASEWTEEVTYRLINHRYNAMLPTVFTSNLPPKAEQGRDLTAALGERIVSRLAEMTTVIPMAGQDRRRAA